MQLKHTMVVMGVQLWQLAMCIPHMDIILEHSLQCVTQGSRSERHIVHVHVLWQTPNRPVALFRLHTDNSQKGFDDQVEYSIVYNLTQGVPTSMSVAGAASSFVYGDAGSGSFFNSSLYHQSEPVHATVFKIAVFVSKESATLLREAQ
jgi:hypothetical protein